MNDSDEDIRRLFSSNKLRFQMELEFIEMLANPWYIQHLAQSRYFDDPAFINYLKYLNYWRKPEYVKFISHTHSLYFLELLQEPAFQERMKVDPEYVNLVHTNQFWHWKFHRFNRRND